jgi:hypothetical protein
VIGLSQHVISLSQYVIRLSYVCKHVIIGLSYVCKYVIGLSSIAIKPIHTSPIYAINRHTVTYLHRQVHAGHGAELSPMRLLQRWLLLLLRRRRRRRLLLLLPPGQTLGESGGLVARTLVAEMQTKARGRGQEGARA